MGINALKPVPGVENAYFDEDAFRRSLGLDVEDEVETDEEAEVLAADGSDGSDEVVKTSAEVIDFPEAGASTEQEEDATDESDSDRGGLERESVAAAAESSVEQPTTGELAEKTKKSHLKLGKLTLAITNLGGKKTAQAQVERTKELLNGDRTGYDVSTGSPAEVAKVRAGRILGNEGRNVSTPELDAQRFVDNWLNEQNMKIKENTELMEDAAAKYKSFMEQAYSKTEAHELQQELLNQAKEWKQREQYYGGEIRKLQEEMKRPEGKYSAVEYADGLAVAALKTSALPLYIQELQKWDNEHEGENLLKTFEQKSNIVKLNELGKFLNNGYEYAHRLNDKISMEYYKAKLDCVRQLQFQQSAEALRELFGEDEVPQEVVEQNNTPVAGETA